MKDSTLLKAIRLHVLGRDPCINISSAIERPVNNRRLGKFAQRSQLRHWVDCMLGDCFDLHSWLQKHGHVTSIYMSPLELARFGATNVAWIDWMISQCEAEENARPWVIECAYHPLAKMAFGQTTVTYIMKARPRSTSFGPIEKALRFKTKQQAENFMQRYSLAISRIEGLVVVERPL